MSRNKDHPNKVIRTGKSVSRIRRHISSILAEIGDPHRKVSLRTAQIKLAHHGRLEKVVRKHGKYLGGGAWKIGDSLFRFGSSILVSCIHDRYYIGSTPLGKVYGCPRNVSKKQYRKGLKYYGYIWFNE